MIPSHYTNFEAPLERAVNSTQPRKLYFQPAYCSHIENHIIVAMEKPVFVATHPRAISTAFERVRTQTSWWFTSVRLFRFLYVASHQLTLAQIFMTRPDILTCVHEPFGDAFYFGPERMSPRYEGDDNREAREESGFAETTFATAIENLGRVSTEVCHLLFPSNSCSSYTTHGYRIPSFKRSNKNY